MMLRLPKIKIGNQIGKCPSASTLKQSIVTTTSNHTVQQAKLNPKQLKSIEKIDYAPNYLSNRYQDKRVSGHFGSFPKVQQLKTMNLNKIKDCVNEIGVLVNAYRLMETDEVKGKNNLFYWFHQVQRIFLNSLCLQPNMANIKTIKRTVQIKNTLVESLQNQVPTLPVRKINCAQEPNMQVKVLKLKIEEYKKDNIQYAEKIEEIFQLVQTLKENDQNLRKNNQLLSQTINAYIHQTDYFLQKLTNKQQKEKILTPLQREIQQIIVKLKFKASDFHFKS